MKLSSCEQRPLGAFLLLAVVVSSIMLCTNLAEAFAPSSIPTASRNRVVLQGSYDPEDEVKRRLVKAKEILEKSKAKMESKQNGKTNNSSNGKEEEEDEESNLPFFASKKARKNPKRREQLAKTINEQTGLIQADGEKMAAMSEQEEWEYRTLLEVFENQITENADVYSAANQQLAQRDVAASIWNLRKTMQNSDYQRIFDKKNFFIGEDM